MSAHARLGASNSHRWLYCPGSVRAEALLPDSSSIYANEGTAAHNLAEAVLLTDGGTAFDWEGKLSPDTAWTVDAEMCSAVQEYVDYVRSLVRKATDELFVEERVEYSDWVPGGFGTCDALVISGATLHVVDLKYGKGHPVSAEENTQAILYALGAVQEYGMLYDIEKINIVIVQPRLDSVSEWLITYDELMKWGEWISARAKIACEPDAPRVPGDGQCKFCRAKGECQALYEFTAKTLACEFDNLEARRTPDHLTDEQKGQVLASKSLIISWMDAVEAGVRERLEAGQDFPGYKLVAGRSLRQWGDEGAAAERLEVLVGEKAWAKKLQSPAQAEKLLGKKRAEEISDLIVKPEGKPTLAPESDKRPAINITAKDFD